MPRAVGDRRGDRVSRPALGRTDAEFLTSSRKQLSPASAMGLFLKLPHQCVYIGVERLAVIAVTLPALAAPEGADSGEPGRSGNYVGLDRPAA